FAQLVEEVAATLRRSSVKTTMTKVQRLPGYGVGHDRSGEFHLGRRSLETKKFDGWTIPVHKGFQLWVSRDGTEWTDGYKKPKWRDYRRCGDPDPVVAYLQVDSSHRANRN